MFESRVAFEYGDRLYEVLESSDFEGTTVNVDAVEVELVLVREIDENATNLLFSFGWLWLRVIVGDVVIV